jgi:hypothetical protein
MADLDPRGLEAAFRAWHDGPIDGRLARTIAAYLDATRPTGEADRIAVVAGQSDAAAMIVEPGHEMDRHGWSRLEGKCYGLGPFVRQIVVIPGGLRRPEPPAEIEGRVEG